MLILLWLLTVAASITAGVAVVRARRLSRRVERAMESYWDLRYEVGQLKARLKRLDPAEPDPAQASPPGGASAFIPVSSLKR